MPLPGDLDTITVTASYPNIAGQPQSGYVTFDPGVVVTDSTGHVILTGLVRCPVNNGQLAPPTLPCTDNSGLNPTGFAYTVTEVINGLKRVYQVQLPHTLGATVDLSAVAPVTQPPTSNTFTGNNTWTGGNTFEGDVAFSEGAEAALVWTCVDDTGLGAWEPSTGGGGSGLINPMTSIGDMIYGSGGGVGTRLAAQTSTTKKFLAETGTGSAGQAPGWAVIVAGDVPTLNQNTTGTAANITDTLDQVPAPVANVSLASHKITGLANGTLSTDAAAFGQIPSALPPNGASGGDLSGTYPNPTVAKVNGLAVNTSPNNTTTFLRADGSWATPGGGGTVTSVTAGDTSIVVGGTGNAPTIETGTLDVIATDHPPAAAWSNNSKKITSLANGSGAQDAAAFGQIPTSASTIGGLLAASNLSDVANAGTSRTNLGLGTAATHATGDFAQTANNLSDLANAATARTNLGLGTAATHATGDFAQTANNLSDLASAATARTNLGLGSSATHAATDFLAVAGGTMTGWLAPAVATLTFVGSGTTLVNAALGNAFALTLTASTTTLGNPTNPVDGQTIRVRVIQGSGGSFTLAYGTAYDFGAGSAPTLSTAAGKVDILGFEYVASLSKWAYLGSGLGF